MTENRTRSLADGLTRRSWWRWLAAGVLFALFLEVLQAISFGGDWSALLVTWDEGPLRPVIEEQLGEIEVFPHGGHDGQVSYVVALDPLGTTYPELREDAALRWRRIGHPAVAGLGGLLDGRALLASLILTACIGYGLVMAATAELATRLRLSRRAPLAVVTCIGLWLSLGALTPDALAAGLAFSGAIVYLRGRPVPAIVLFAAAGLTKEPYLLMAASVSALAWVEGRRREAAALLFGPVAIMVPWYTYVAATIGPISETNDSISLPLRGIRESIETFSLTPPGDQVMLVLAYILVIFGIVATVATGHRTLRYLAVPWIVSAFFLAGNVWRLGNNPLRVLLPVWILAGLFVAEVAGRRATPQSAHPSLTTRRS